MSTIKVVVEITGYSSHVSDPDMEDHLAGIASDIKRYAEEQVYVDYNRKIQTDYEEQEDANLSINASVMNEDGKLR